MKPMIVLIAGHFSTFVKFCEIPQIHQNFAKKANSVARLEIPRHAENCGPYLHAPFCLQLSSLYGICGLAIVTARSLVRLRTVSAGMLQPWASYSHTFAYVSRRYNLVLASLLRT